MADDDLTPSDDPTEPPPADEQPEPPPAGEEPEPPPAGEEPEPPPAGEEPEPAPEGEEPPPAPSEADSSTGEDSSDSDTPKRHKKSSDSDDSSSSSDDSDLHGQQSVSLSTDDVQIALVSAFQARNVPVDDSGMEVTFPDIGLYRFSIRLSEAAMPLPKVPDDTSDLPAGSVQGAWLLVLGDVQLQDGATRVTMRLVKVETSEILQAGKGDASGTANKDAVESAAQDALAALTMLNTQ